MSLLENRCVRGLWLAAMALALATTARAQSCTAPPPDMVGWWTGDDCSGDDYLGSYDASFTGNPVCSIYSKVGGAALGNFGSGTYFYVPDAPGLNFPDGEMSVDLWFRPEATGPLVSKINSGYGWELRLDSAGVITLIFCTTQVCGFLDSSGPPMSWGTWQFIGFSFAHDSTSERLTATLYNNGAIDTWGPSVVGEPPTAYGGDLVFGAGWWSDGFYGQLDEIELFGRALDTIEFEGIYFADSAGKCRFPSYSAVCFGDALSSTPCPCGNTGAVGQGCANSTGEGGILSGSGHASVTQDTFSLTASGIINNVGLFFQGNNTLGGGMGVIFGDGIRCCGGAVVQIQAVNPPGTTSPATVQMTDTATTNGPAGTIAAGVKKCYQYWYRDPAGSPCGANFNLTNAITVTWQP